jgi:hypothetical protein
MVLEAPPPQGRLESLETNEITGFPLCRWCGQRACSYLIVCL